MLLRSLARAAQPRLIFKSTSQPLRISQLSARLAHNRAPRKPFPANNSGATQKEFPRTRDGADGSTSSSSAQRPSTVYPNSKQQGSNWNVTRRQSPGTQQNFNAGESNPTNLPPRNDRLGPTLGQRNTQAGTGNASNEASKNSPGSQKTPEDSTGPLPDLRQGIPSTFEAEFLKQQEQTREAAAEGKGDLNVTEDPQKAQSGSYGGRGAGDLPKSAYETSTDRRRNRQLLYSLLAFALFGSSGYVYLGRDWETEEEEKAHPDAPNGWSLMSMWNRANARFGGQLGYYTEPTFPKLLPTMDPPPPYTLVLSLEDLLVHSEWSREHGWRTAKRPGLDYFLRYLCQYYEIVLFTSLPMGSADLVVKKLDPYRITIMWPLFREATRYEKGEYIKDLSYLNRDLSKVVLIDTKAEHAKYQPENAIILPKWDGRAGDKGLVNLIPFLEHIAAMGVTDVRKAIKSFEGKDIASEFALREAKAREEFNKSLAADQSKRPKRSAGGFLMGALGMKNQGGGMMLEDGKSLSEGFAQGKTLSDQVRERGMKQYEALEKEIRENGDKWLKEMEADEKRQQEEWMKSMKSGFVGWIPGSGRSQAGPSGEEK